MGQQELSRRSRECGSSIAGMKRVSALGYLDDVIIFSDSFERHLVHLETFSHRAREGNLQLNPLKSPLCQKETAYLGLLVSSEGVRPGPAKTDPIRKFPRPVDKKGV